MPNGTFCTKLAKSVQNQIVAINIEFYIFKIVRTPGHNILELYNILVWVRFTTS